VSKVKQIFDGFFWTLILNLFNAIYGFISVPLLLNHFGKENFGLIGVAVSINVYLKLLDMGFSSGNVKFFAGYLAKFESEKLRELFQASLLFYILIGFLNVLVLVGISIYSEEIFSLSFVQNLVFKRLVLILIITSLGGWVGSVMEQFLRANDLIGWQQRLLLFSKIVQLATLFLTIYFNFSILIFFLLFTVSSLIPLPFYIYKIKSLQLNISFFPRYNKKIFNEVLPYSISIFSFSIFQFSANYLRPIILGVKVGLESVSEYRILEGFASLVMILGASFVGIILPIATKVKSLGDRERELRIAYEGTKYISIFIALLVFGFLLVSDDLMFLYVGNDYKGLIVWLNIWIITLLGLHNSGLSGLVLSNNSLKPIVYMSAISTIISLAAAWLLVEKFKIGGVIIGYLIYVIFQLIFYYGFYYPFVMKYNSLKIFFQSFFIPTVIIGACYGLLFSFKSYIPFENRYFKIILLEIIFTIFSSLAIYFISFDKKDKIFLLSRIFKKKDKIAENF
jgi:O-antigen/teichoic acid export membrane protein